MGTPPDRSPDAGPAPTGRQTVERIARTGYGRLLALVAARTGDLAAAEDALGDALIAALTAWPRDGVPARPEAWLLTTARRRLIDRQRRAGTHAGAELDLALVLDALGQANSGGTSAVGEAADTLPDRRLGLMLACAHPAIDAAIHTPLILQTVLGLEAARIAEVFLTSPAAMAQRLVRAKAKIRAAGISFEVPGRDALAPRLEPLLRAIYAAYTAAWDDAFLSVAVVPGMAPRDDLAGEALWLAELLSQLLPNDGEPAGLHALILYAEARRPARRAGDGSYVPLDAQDPQRWSADMIERADRLLHEAGRRSRPGRWQIEAAIQAVHCARRHGGRTDWGAVVQLSRALCLMAPSIGAHIALAAALGRDEGPAAGLAVLAGLPEAAVASHQPYWAVRGDLLARAGESTLARSALTRAMGLALDPAVRSWLAAQAARLA